MKIIEGTSENFEKVVLKSKIPVLVDFNAVWCPPCQALHPTLEEMSEDSDEYQIVTVDVDEEQMLAGSYGVSSIPCLIVFKDGEEVDRRVGLQPRKRLEKILGVR
ncbi:MAG: thioredoxin [Candidatus Saccharibacteria bacterium]|nr:thioredoxin [Candidatus Saccharibacteria bacterium]